MIPQVAVVRSANPHRLADATAKPNPYKKTAAAEQLGHIGNWMSHTTDISTATRMEILPGRKRKGIKMTPLCRFPLRTVYMIRLMRVSRRTLRIPLCKFPLRTVYMFRLMRVSRRTLRIPLCRFPLRTVYMIRLMRVSRRTPRIPLCNFPLRTVYATRRMLSSMASQGPARISAAELQLLVNSKLNGRQVRDFRGISPVPLAYNRLQIKNIMSTAQALATKEKSRLCSLTFKDCYREQGVHYGVQRRGRHESLIPLNPAV